MVEKSFADEVVGHTAKLRAYARKLGGSRAFVDDLVQETVLRALVHAVQFTAGTNLQAWLYTILRNCYFNELRQARRYSGLIEAGDSASESPVGADQIVKIELKELADHVAALPPAQRQALSLVAVEGNSYEAAALKVGCRCGTMKSRVSRARAALSEAVEVGEESKSRISNETPSITISNISMMPLSPGLHPVSESPRSCAFWCLTDPLVAPTAQIDRLDVLETTPCAYGE